MLYRGRSGRALYEVWAPAVGTISRSTKSGRSIVCNTCVMISPASLFCDSMVLPGMLLLQNRSDLMIVQTLLEINLYKTVSVIQSWSRYVRSRHRTPGIEPHDPGPYLFSSISSLCKNSPSGITVLTSSVPFKINKTTLSASIRRKASAGCLLGPKGG